jgi:hypothetical protein
MVDRILMGFIKDFFNWVNQQFWDTVNWFFDLVKRVIEAVFTMLGDVLFWMFEQVLDLLVVILNTLGSLDFSVFNPGTYISAMPSEVTSILALIRIPEAVGIIAGAIIIKITLQLIPFTRLGS